MKHLFPATALAVMVSASVLAANINEKMAQFDFDKGSLEEVIRVFGPPLRFVWGGRTFTRENLPETYLAEYPLGFMVMLSHGKTVELRHHEPGYLFRGKAGVGSTAEELFEVTGRPAKTVPGETLESIREEAGVLYTDLKGRPGISYYPRADLGARIFLMKGRVAAVYVTGNQATIIAPANAKTVIPSFNPNSRAPAQVDLRGKDLSSADLRPFLKDLMYATFDTSTRWPSDDRLPKEYDRARIMELGKNPGLGVRSLHRKGITGRGTSIAMIDHPLRRDHREYADRLRHYEEINTERSNKPHFHGSSALSLAAGKTVGVAPEAEIYYVGLWPMDAFGALDFRYLAEGVRRVLKVNEGLPKERRIRVLSMQIGWQSGQAGYDQIAAAVNAAKTAGIFVVCSSLEQVHGFKFQGLGRAPLADPDQAESFEPGLFWAPSLAAGRGSSDRLLAPMDSRTAAGADAPDHYVYYRDSGWSWVIPYLAGVYALAAQADPAITPQRFWETANQSGRTIQWRRGDVNAPLGPIIDPVALIGALQRRTTAAGR